MDQSNGVRFRIGAILRSRKNHQLTDFRILITMVVRLRLARWGRVHSPFYRIVAADARYPRDGRHLEILGTYNPLAATDGVKELRVNNDRVKYWLSVGAQPSDRVSFLLGLANVLPIPPSREYTKKNQSKQEEKAK
ncbi:hypothetical protein DYB26_001101 [Aphanomyces astaci]|uniref:Ribosomal protein S16 n=1 Tax=Aphanomyces astaci TaxID=112090 RepID=A0A3R7A498_APHAT|nr:hypothetical protein DYB26_001101 [Aphanomyces astaci]